MKTPLIPVSWGELIDKISILEIKRERIPSPSAQQNIVRELQQLEQLAQPALVEGSAVVQLKAELGKTNRELWVIEDDLRDLESAGDFGERFISLARSVYRLNDQRARLKKEVDLALGSELTEEKSYKDWQ